MAKKDKGVEIDSGAEVGSSITSSVTPSRKTSSSSGRIDSNIDLTTLNLLQTQIEDLRSSLKDEEQQRIKIQKEFKKQREDINNALDETKERIENNRNDNVQTLAVFVALFTFISVDFQIFKQISDFYSALSLVMILLGALTFFVLLLNQVLSKTIWTSGWILTVVFFIIGFIILIQGWGGITKEGSGQYFRLDKTTAMNSVKLLALH